MLTDVRKGVTQIATITYLADGTKVKVRAADGTALLYRGKFIYRAALNGLPTIESVEHDHGRFLPGNSANEFIDTWHVRDYLGSTRTVFDITPDYAEDLSEVILEQNDYCLFGSRIDNADLPALAQNRFRFNGKENLIAGANDTKLTDYGARMYSAPLARWTTPDPLADKYYSISPYAFCNNNPVNLVDPDGNRWVNSKGQVVYDSNGLTAYATHEEAYLANTMQKTRTGSKQLKKIAEAPFDVEVVINSIDRPNYYGITENAGIMINRTTGQYTPKHSRITLYKLKAIRRSVFLWMMDALAINFAHEIEHITDQNLKLQYEGRSVEEREESPDRISQEMTREYYNIEPLKSTDDLYRLLNHLVQSNKNIQINFSN